MNRSLRVFFLEHNEVWRAIYRVILGKGLDPVVAETVPNALKLWREDKVPFDAVVIDADDPHPEHLVADHAAHPSHLLREIGKSDFRGPIIAISENTWNSQGLLCHGCTHSCTKESLRLLLVELIGLDERATRSTLSVQRR